jgi:hypothetical protein
MGGGSAADEMSLVSVMGIDHHKMLHTRSYLCFSVTHVVPPFFHSSLVSSSLFASSIPSLLTLQASETSRLGLRGYLEVRQRSFLCFSHIDFSLLTAQPFRPSPYLYRCERRRGSPKSSLSPPHPGSRSLRSFQLHRRRFHLRPAQV